MPFLTPRMIFWRPTGKVVKNSIKKPYLDRKFISLHLMRQISGNYWLYLFRSYWDTLFYGYFRFRTYFGEKVVPRTRQPMECSQKEPRNIGEGRDTLEVAGTPWKQQGPPASGNGSLEVARTPWEEQLPPKCGRDPLDVTRTTWRW